MTAQEYLEILGRLPIENPTEEDFAALCPHLTPEEAAEVFSHKDPFVAVPAVKVKAHFTS